MNYVEPIRDPALVKDIDEYLEENKRDQLLYEFGIYTGLRISDILKFKVYDVLKDTYTIREQKTGKQKTFKFNPILKKHINEYIEGKDNNEYLFKSRIGVNRPISRVRAYQILKRLQTVFPTVGNIGTHTLRKTFGYHYYQQFKRVADLMFIFNHSSEEVTLRYIGVKTDEINKTFENFKIF